MTLVLRDKNLSLSEGDKLFGDVLVTEGTLLLLDFSNLGTTEAFNVNNGAPIRNLAEKTAENLARPITGRINTPNPNNQLTPDKGFTAAGISGAMGPNGINVFGLMDYLTLNKDHDILILMWADNGTPGLARPFLRTWSEGDYANTSLRANISATGNITVTVGGAQVVDTGMFPPASGIYTTAYHYKGVGESVRTWINTTDKGDTSMKATGFNASGKIFVVGKPETTVASNATIYRMVIEDLTVSGRTPEEVILKDWNYVNALGDFTGIVKRPYAIR